MTKLLVSLIIFSFCISQDLRQTGTFTYNNLTYEFGYQFPNDFDATKTYPVILGPGTPNVANEQSFYWKGTSDTFGWILIDYPIYRKQNQTKHISALLHQLRKQFKVEGNKFHAVCFSANSASIFELVMKMSNDFQGITGMAGNPDNAKTTLMKNLKTVNVQFIVGDKDPYWMRSAKKSHKLLKDAGVNTQIEIIENGPHVMTELVGKGFLERAHRLRDKK